MFRARLMRDAGWALILTPAIMLSVLIYGAWYDPGLLAKYWEVYGLFVVLPWVAGIVLLVMARRIPS